jgi:hypothetical protein
LRALRIRQVVRRKFDCPVLDGFSVFHLAGRFAECAYINSDEVLYRGFRLGQSLAHTG